MKGKHITFLVLPALVYGLFLFFAPMAIARAGALITEGWNDSSACTASECGTTEGTKTQDFYSEECDLSCPTIHFEWSRKIYDSCPTWYVVRHGHPDQCVKLISPWNTIDRPYHWDNHSADVVYDKSADPNHCHRPSDADLEDIYGMDHDARQDFKAANSELKDVIKSNCHLVITDSRTVSCTAELIPCEGICPTECGYAGGTVPDGLGGLKTCDPTNSCSTYRWCFPDDESPTGYLAQAISISIPTPSEGKPWESGKMLDRYCSYEPAGTCPTECGYEGGDVVADGQGGTITCEATTVCEEPEMCKWDDKLEADDPECPKDCEWDATISEDDPLCAPKDDEDVLSDEDEVKETGVVLGATGPTDNLDIYLVELLLVAISISSYVFLSKKYLKNSR